MKDEYAQMIDDNKAIIAHVERCKNAEWYERQRATIDTQIERLQRERGQLDDYHHNADRIIDERHARIAELRELRAQWLNSEKLQRLLRMARELNATTDDDELASYVDRALSMLPEVEDPSDLACVRECLERCEAHGWDIDDAVAYAALTEHVDPSLPEEEALDRMSAIASKYPGSKV